MMTTFNPIDDFTNTTELPTEENVFDMLQDGTYCSVEWDDLWSNYNHDVHYPLLLFICVVGCLTNVVNFFIFTRSEMQNPTNLLLSILAATDFLCVFRKVIGASLKIHRQGVDERMSYNKRAEDWINEICFYLFHTWSIYMTVAVALWRLLGILRPMQSRYWFSYKSAALVASTFISFATVLVPLLFVGTSLELQYNGPVYDDYQSNHSINDEHFENETSVVLDPDYLLTQTDFGDKLQFWIQGLLIKLIPCFVLIVCTVLLIMSLKVAANNRLALFEDQKTAQPDQTGNNSARGDENENFGKITTPSLGTCPAVKVSSHDKSQDSQNSATREFIRTTKMLIILLILFLVTELPPGIFAFCVGLIDSKKFFMQCYMPIRPFLNLNEYISSSVGFFIYLYMSTKYRQTFCQQFRIKSRTRRQDNSNSTFFSFLSPKLCFFSSKGETEPTNASNIITDVVVDVPTERISQKTT